MLISYLENDEVYSFLQTIDCICNSILVFTLLLDLLV